MATLLLSISSLLLVAKTEWITSSSSIALECRSRDDMVEYGMAVGKYNDTIFLLSQTAKLVYYPLNESFNITLRSFDGQRYGMGQWYNQLNDGLYMINKKDSSIDRYSLSGPRRIIQSRWTVIEYLTTSKYGL